MVSPMLVTTIADPATSVRPLSRADVGVLLDAGHLADERVELLEGVLVAMRPMNDPHARAVMLLDRWLQRGLPDRFGVRPQLPFVVDDFSEPEPDLAVVDFDPDTGDHPRVAHLVIEVTQSTHHTDLVVKPCLYARARVPRYWVVDLANRRLVEHTDPAGEAYTTIVEHEPEAVMTFEGVDVQVGELLGRPGPAA